MHKWTDAQKNAISARNSNIIVSAAAGSGKTTVLVERLVRRILDELDDINLDELLVVTFTNAAASEMKSRISKALSDKLKVEQNNTYLAKQILLLPNAHISTIDSFCINLVRENFFRLDIEQDFRILDESETKLIEQSVIEEIVEQLYEENSDEFKSLVELLSTTKNDSELINSVQKIFAYSAAQPYPEVWLEQIAEIYNPEKDFDSGIIKECIIDEIRFVLSYIKSIIEEEKQLLEYDVMYDKYIAMLESDEKKLSSLFDSLTHSWDEIRKSFYEVSFGNTVSKEKGFNADYIELLKNKRSIYSSKNGIIQSKVLPLISPDLEAIKKDNEILYPVFLSLIKLIMLYSEKLLKAKKEIGAYTFSDIEHFAIQLLFVPDGEGGFARLPLADELSAHFKEILVDEYQDTNAAQDTLFKMLSDGKNRFMVGDVKQSIYRFRLAMPSIFNRKKDTYKPYSENSKELNQKIILDRNFRSRQGICDFTNFLFSHLMSEKIGELDYSSEDYLVCGANYCDKDTADIKLCLVNTPEGEDKTEAEARRIGEMIINKVNGREQIRQDDNSTRDITYGDFAVLLRSARNTMPVYAKVFSEMGIPTLAGNRNNLFENNEVSVLLSLLRVIDNPVQDIPLLATLMSVFYGYTADDLTEAKINFPNADLYTAIANDEKFSRFTDDLKRYGKYASTMNVESFIRLIINETSYMSLISVMGNCEQRKLNVYKLIDIARAFDKGESVGLTAFIRYIDRICDEKLSVDSAELTGAGENAVQIMSIHQSKGLEFPVVILADAAHKYNKRDTTESLLLSSELGAGLKVNVEEGLYRYNSLQYEAVKLINSDALMSENLRVLYVAVTRAKEQFIMFASDKCVENKIAGCSEKVFTNYIHPYAVKTATSDAELIITAALLCKSCDELRKYATAPIVPDTRFDFKLETEIINGDSDLSQKDSKVTAYDSELVEQISEKLSFRYDRLSVASYSSKRTASSLDDGEHSFTYLAKSKPAFLSKSRLTPAQRGTAMHAFMQYCDYKSAKSDLDSEIERLTDGGYITKLQAQSLNRSKLNTLFSSDFAKRIFESDRVYREIKVSSFVPLSELEDTEYGDKVLVQGIADCVFEEEGKLVLVDYKTDYVKDENELLNMYKKQLSFYKSAVSKTLGKEVKEVMLYSFELGKPCVYK